MTSWDPRPPLVEGELLSIRIIRTAPPERRLRIGDVGDPITAPRIFQGGNRSDGRSQCKRRPLSGRGITAHNLAANLIADRENPAPVLAWSGRAEMKRSRGQLYRSLCAPTPLPPTRLSDRPQAGDSILLGLEDEVGAVRSPAAAALRCRGVPAWQQRAKPCAVGSDFPKRRLAGISHGER